MWYALAATDAVVCLPQTRDIAVVADEESAACALVIGILVAFVRQITFFDAFIVVGEDGRDIDSVWARHAIIAFVAWDVFQIVDITSDLHEKSVFVFAYWSQGRKCAEVLA